MEKKDYCTWFFEKFPVWVKPWRWKVEDISNCCKIHDDTCSFHKFIKCLWSKRVVFTTVITLGGSIGCLFRYPKIVWKRIF